MPQVRSQWRSYLCCFSTSMQFSNLLNWSSTIFRLFVLFCLGSAVMQQTNSEHFTVESVVAKSEVKWIALLYNGPKRNSEMEPIHVIPARWQFNRRRMNKETMKHTAFTWIAWWYRAIECHGPTSWHSVYWILDSSEPQWWYLRVFAFVGVSTGIQRFDFLQRT